MAIHARLCRRNIGDGRSFNITVTIAAIHPQVTGVQLVTKWQGLCRTIADISVFWRSVVPQKANPAGPQYENRRQKNRGELICPLWKYLRQKESSNSYFFHKALCNPTHAKHRYCYVTFSMFRSVLAEMIKKYPIGVKNISVESADRHRIDTPQFQLPRIITPH